MLRKISSNTASMVPMPGLQTVLSAQTLVPDTFPDGNKKWQDEAAHRMGYLQSQWKDTSPEQDPRLTKMMITWRWALSDKHPAGDPYADATAVWLDKVPVRNMLQYASVHLAEQEKDPASVLNHYRRMIELRQDVPALAKGNMALLDKTNLAVQIFTKTYKKHTLLVLLNLTPNPAPFRLQLDLSKSELLISNYYTLNESSRLRPYEASIYWL